MCRLADCNCHRLSIQQHLDDKSGYVARATDSTEWRARSADYRREVGNTRPAMFHYYGTIGMAMLHVGGARNMTNDGGVKTIITTVDRAIDVLTLFATKPQPTLGVTEIAHELGLSKAAVHRLLTTLVAKDYIRVDRESRRYALGPAVLALGLAYLERIDIRRLALPVMRDLSAATNETSTLSIRSGWTRVYVDQVTPAREVRMSVQLGRPFPLHAGSSSKAFLAFLDETERERYLAETPLERLTDATIVDPRDLRAEIAKIRERGYALSFGERQAGAASVAAPVRDHLGRPIATISICGPIERFRDHTEKAAKLLLTATAELSAQLGYHANAAVDG